MSVDSFEKKLKLKELEVRSLLEVTQAINENTPEDKLYRIFQFTLLGHMRLSRMALYVREENWECKFAIGGKANISHDTMVKMEDRFKKMTFLTADSFEGLPGYDVVIPVAHKTQILAFLLVAGDPVVSEEDEEYLNFIRTLSNIMLVAIENKRLERRRRDQEALKRELEIARQFQRMLVPEKLPDLASFKVHATYLPHHSVGGDYYDLIKLSKTKYLICIADVSGKGVPAAMLMSNLQAGLHVLSKRGIGLKDLVGDLNHLIHENANVEYFITFFLAEIDLENKVLQYVNAGHNYPVLLQNGEVTELIKGCAPLGVLGKLPMIEQGEVQLKENALLFLYTDGLTETEDKAGEEFGTERVESILKKQKDGTLANLHEQMIEGLNAFKGPKLRYKDDVTFVSCKIL